MTRKPRALRAAARSIDEPYQHFQFAGRADVLAWDLGRRDLLHLENRTRFPNVQEAAGSFTAKRAYLGGVLASRLGLRSWRSETHVVVGLWSAEILQVLRRRSATLRALCPDDPEAFARWWTGRPESVPAGIRSTLVVMDPASEIGRARRFVGLDDALRAGPRFRDYADAARAPGISRG